MKPLAELSLLLPCVSGLDPFLRASVMGWNTPHTYEMIEELTQDYRHSVSLTTTGADLDIPGIACGKWRRAVARVVYQMLHEAPLFLPVELWVNVKGSEMVDVALATKHEDCIISTLSLAGDLLRKAEDLKVPFVLPRSIDELCRYLPQAFETGLLPDYAQRLRRRNMGRRYFAFADDMEAVYHETPLANIHIACMGLSLRIKQSILSDRIMRYLAKNRLRWISIGDIDFPQVPAVESVDESLRRLFFTAPEQLLLGVEIEYQDSYVYGTGIARDWFARLYERIFDAKSNMYFAFDRINGVYKLHPDLISNPRFQLAQFRAIGTALGLSVVEAVPTGAKPNYGLLKFLLSNSEEVNYSMADLEEDDILVYKSLDFIRVSCAGDEGVTTLSCEDALEDLYFDAPNGVALLPGSPRVTRATLPLYIDLMVEYFMHTRYRNFYFAMRTGFREVLPLEIIEGVVSPRELGGILQGEHPSTVTVNELRKYLQHDFEPRTQWEINLHSWFWTFLEEDPSRPLKLLRFVTGLNALPVGGLAMITPPVSVYVQTFNPNRLLPEAKLCFSQLILPLYPQKELLERYLGEAIENIDIANAL